MGSSPTTGTSIWARSVSESRRSAPRDGSRPDWAAVSGHRDPGQRQLGDLDVGLLEGDRHRVDLLGRRPSTGRRSRSAPRPARPRRPRSSASSRATLFCAASTRDPAADVLPLRPAARPSWPSRPPRRAPAAEQAAEDRAGRRQQVVALARLLLLGGDLGGVGRRRRSGCAASSPWPRTCRAAWRPRRRRARRRPAAQRAAKSSTLSPGRPYSLRSGLVGISSARLRVRWSTRSRWHLLPERRLADRRVGEPVGARRRARRRAGRGRRSRRRRRS